MRNRPTGRDGNRLMVYKSEDGMPWLLFEVVNGFVTKLESANARGAIRVNGNIAVRDELSREEETKVYDRVAKARLTKIDGLLKFLREHLEAVGT